MRKSGRQPKPVQAYVAGPASFRGGGDFTSGAVRPGSAKKDSSPQAVFKALDVAPQDLVGRRVEVNWNRAGPFLGRVAAYNSTGEFEIKYDDGDSEWGLFGLKVFKTSKHKRPYVFVEADVPQPAGVPSTSPARPQLSTPSQHLQEQPAVSTRKEASPTVPAATRGPAEASKHATEPATSPASSSPAIAEASIPTAPGASVEAGITAARAEDLLAPQTVPGGPTTHDAATSLSQAGHAVDSRKRTHAKAFEPPEDSLPGGEAGPAISRVVSAALPRLMALLTQEAEACQKLSKVLHIWSERRLLPETIMKAALQQLDKTPSSAPTGSQASAPTLNDASVNGAGQVFRAAGGVEVELLLNDEDSGFEDADAEWEREARQAEGRPAGIPPWESDKTAGVVPPPWPTTWQSPSDTVGGAVSSAPGSPWHEAGPRHAGQAGAAPRPPPSWPASHLPPAQPLQAVRNQADVDFGLPPGLHVEEAPPLPASPGPPPLPNSPIAPGQLAALRVQDDEAPPPLPSDAPPPLPEDVPPLADYGLPPSLPPSRWQQGGSPEHQYWPMPGSGHS
ncbi:hypothetical protein WJX72_002923 [[Myrmecia] bisecta]|uniref:Uncharacterized protein n=1 Tax=[Myrmecia] bisecta TaxID=41462 RepID=A0AAW1PET6_9CHLO